MIRDQDIPIIIQEEEKEDTIERWHRIKDKNNRI